MPAESIGNLQRFEDRFFGCKARSVVLTWTGLSVAVSALCFGEDARGKATVTAQKSPFHSRDQAKIQSNTHDHRLPDVSHALSNWLLVADAIGIESWTTVFDGVIFRRHRASRFRRCLWMVYAMLGRSWTVLVAAAGRMERSVRQH